MTGPRIVLAVTGVLVAVLGAILGGGGIATLVAQRTDIGPEGFATTPAMRSETPLHALVSEAVDLGAEPSFWAEGIDLLEVRLTAESARPGGRIFVGIGPADRVAGYLDGVAYARLDRGLGASGGARRPGPPGSRRFWAASAEGAGRQRLDWRVRSGDWTVVVMNADAARGVRADLTVGERWSHVLAWGIGATVVGMLGLAGGIALLVANVRRRRRGPAAPPPVVAPQEPEPEPEPRPEPPAAAEPPVIRGAGTPAPTPGPAIVALAAGVVGLIMVPLVPSVAAVILGRHARRTIDASPAPIAGRGVATAGMWLGWAGVVLTPALIALTVWVLGPAG